MELRWWYSHQRKREVHCQSNAVSLPCDAEMDSELWQGAIALCMAGKRHFKASGGVKSASSDAF